MEIKDYVKTNWINDKTKLNADNLNHIEDGIENATNEIKNLDNKITQLEEFAGIKKITLNGIEGSLDPDIWENLQSKPESYSFYLTQEDLMLSYAKNNTDDIDIQFAYTYNDVEYLKEYYLVVINGNWHLEIIENTLPNKVDKIEGKELSTNDFTNQYKEELDTLPNKLNKDLVTNIDTNVSGDNININIKYINLDNNNEQNITKTLSPVTNTAPGLMTSEDLNTLNTLKSKVENLEGKTTRLLYTESTNPTKEEINTFVTGLGYTSPFEGIAVVIAQTYHIWHYYSNDDIGWKDDGQDTVSTFTNDIAGIIKGAGEIEGKVYAESDGTGSVYGWDVLTTKIDNHINNTNNPHKVTKEQIELGNVNNTSDLDKPVSNQQKEYIKNENDDVLKKANDYTDSHLAEKKQLVTEVTALGTPTKDDPYIVIKDEKAYRRNSIIDPSTPILYVPENGYHVYYIVKVSDTNYYIIWSKTDNFTTYGTHSWSNDSASAKVYGSIAANSYYTTAVSVSEAINKIKLSSTTYTKGSYTFTMASDSEYGVPGYPEAYASISNPFIRASMITKTYTSSSTATGNATGNYSYTSEETQSNIPQIKGYFSDEVPTNSYKKLADNEDLESHINNKSNPHKVTKAQVGLSNVDNTSDLDKPISNDTKTYVDNRDNKVLQDAKEYTDSHSPFIEKKQLVTEVTILEEPTKSDPYIVVKDEEVYRRNALIDTTLPTLYIPEVDYHTYYIVKGNTNTYYIVWSKTDNLSIVGRGDSSNSNNIIALITLSIPTNNYYTTANSESEAISKITSITTYTKSTSDITFDLASASSTSSSSYSATATVSLTNPPFIKSNVPLKTYVTSNYCYWDWSSEGLPSYYIKRVPTEATQSDISFINGNFSDEITPNSYKKLATKEYVDNLVDEKIGNINTILDKINGEEI